MPARPLLPVSPTMEQPIEDTVLPLVVGDGRGRFATGSPSGVHSSGRHKSLRRYGRPFMGWLQRAMEIREIRGRRVTTRQGAAEHLGYSDQTIELLAAKRAETGFPDPADVETEGRGIRTRTEGGNATGREWYALDDLDQFKIIHAARVDGTRGARVREPLPGDPEELLTGPEIAAALKIKSATWGSWVRDSKLDWAAGRKAYLPKPDEVSPGRRGVVRKWKRGTINTEFLPREGKWSAAGAPEGRRVTVEDLAAVLAAGGAEQTNEDLALALTELAGRPVKLPTVSRLKKALRDANS